MPTRCHEHSEPDLRCAAPPGIVLALAIALPACHSDFDFQQLDANLPRYIDTVQTCRLTAMHRDRPWRVTRGEVSANQALPDSRHAWAVKCGNTPVMVDFPDPGSTGRPSYYNLHTGMRIRVRVTRLTALVSGYNEVMPEWTRGRIHVVRYEGED